MPKKIIVRKAVTPQEAAEIYGLSVGSLANLRVKRQGARYHLCGRRVFYLVEDLEAWLLRNPVLTIDSLPEGHNQQGE
ncbi:MAG: helix-turn-helix domain-containing protein [Deltaproteobacteria bacterium]|nr:helix-turn-helix domain-containing protein [Deltaproteobacteria bacterium]